MKQQKAKFTWHYYVMAAGVLLALLAGTLSAWGSVMSAVGLSVISHPRLEFKGLTRFFFLVTFAILYAFAFPEADVIREMMPEGNTLDQSH